MLEVIVLSKSTTFHGGSRDALRAGTRIRVVGSSGIGLNVEFPRSNLELGSFPEYCGVSGAVIFATDIYLE